MIERVGERPKGCCYRWQFGSLQAYILGHSPRFTSGIPAKAAIIACMILTACTRRQWAVFVFQHAPASLMGDCHLSERAIQGLRRTRVPLLDIEFAPAINGDRPDPASALLLTDSSLLLGSLTTLKVWHPLHGDAT